MDRSMTPARLVLMAAVLGGVSYVASWNLGLGEVASLAWKGSGVGLLAVYAALKARDRDGWLICAVMAFGALGDVLLGLSPLAGGGAFLVGHLIAIWLYLRNWRMRAALRDGLLAVLLVPASVAVAVLLVPAASKAGVGVYALGLSLMAAAAWVSRFPRWLTGIGALMFLDSDLLIFARMGPWEGQAWVGYAVWSLYFAGQLLIVLGVTRTLAATRTPPAGLP